MPRGQKKTKSKISKGSELAEKLSRVFRKNSFAKPGERLGVAVSGGADSVALLRLLLECRTELGFVPVVLHFNHQLRGKDSLADERFVAKLAKNLRLEFLVGREDVAARTKRERGNVEEVARRARYGYFEKLQKENRISKVAVAHTADDQAETVLGHILRGTGLSGLRGIHPQTELLFRPLLGVRRTELRDYLGRVKQNWREDKTNQDVRRNRARIRAQLLPLLEKKFNVGVVEHLCQLAVLAGEDEDYLARQTTEWMKGATRGTSDQLSIGLDEWFAAPAALRTRALRFCIAQVKTRSGQLGREHVEAVWELAAQGRSGKTLQLPGGVEVRRERDLLRFYAFAGPGNPQKKYSRPGFAKEVHLSDGRAEVTLVELSCLLHFREIDWPAERGETSSNGVMLDRSRLREPLVVRNWRPGDAMRPIGHLRVHKLARLLREQSVSRWDKESWPVLTSGGKIVWTRGLPVEVEFAIGPETRRAVRIIEEAIK